MAAGNAVSEANEVTGGGAVASSSKRGFLIGLELRNTRVCD